MTVKGFLFLLAVTMAAIALGALVGDRVAAPGFERTVVVAIVAASISYVLTSFGWRLLVARKRARRLSERGERAGSEFPPTGIE